MAITQETATPVELSIIIPVFNEVDNIGRLCSDVSTVAKSLGLSHEVIFVDDGSDDGTFEALKDLKRSQANMSVIRLARNFGQTAALSAGFELARGRVIVTMDGDLQNDAEDIPLLLREMEKGYDLVSGWRVDRKDHNLSRKLPSKVANKIIGWVTGVKLHDYGCALKVYKASSLKALHLYSNMHRFVPAVAKMRGVRITEVPVRHHPRIYGRSKYGLERVWVVLLDLLVISLILKFSSKPSHWFGILSVPYFFLSFVSGLAAAWSYLAHSTGVFSMVFPTLALLFFVLGSGLLMHGFLSELIVRTAEFRAADSVEYSLL